MIDTPDSNKTSRRLVADRSGTGRRPRRDLSATKSVAARFLNIFDFSTTSAGPIGDLVVTSAIGGNSLSGRGLKAAGTYV